jgi:hypothetical protein
VGKWRAVPYGRISAAVNLSSALTVTYPGPLAVLGQKRLAALRLDIKSCEKAEVRRMETPALENRICVCTAGIETGRTVSGWDFFMRAKPLDFLRKSSRFPRSHKRNTGQTSVLRGVCSRSELVAMGFSQSERLASGLSVPTRNGQSAPLPRARREGVVLGWLWIGRPT